MTRPTIRAVGLLTAGLLLVGCGASDDATGPQAADDSHDDAMGDGHGIGEPADASEADRTIEISMLDTMAYEPAALEVDAGEVVTFLVSNDGQAVHEFTLGDEAMQDEHAEEMAEMGADMAHDGPNSVTVQPGDTGELTWRFGESGTVQYACHQPGHYEAGMVGEITIP